MDVEKAYILAHENAVLYAPDRPTLTRLCREAIAQGWRCYGFPTHGNGCWRQIMIRDRNPPPPFL